MRVLGIVAEYNPFHNGHIYHLTSAVEKSKADYAICVMSGNFTQRGEPAIWDKWTRAKIAVDCGIDLVLELPFIYSCNSAEYFAKGSIDILERLGCVTHMAFGCEEADVKKLQKTAELLADETREYKAILTEQIKTGISFAAARQEAVSRILDDEYGQVLSYSNNILAVEYLKELRRIESKIKPIALERRGNSYNDSVLTGHISSATAVRRAILTGEDISEAVPGKVSEIVETPADLSIFFPYIRKELITMTCDELRNIFSMSEGLENRMKKALVKADDLRGFTAEVKSKRYPLSRIKRTMIHLLMGLTKERFIGAASDKALYGRILAMNHKGAFLIRKMKNDNLASIPLITNINKEIGKLEASKQMLSFDTVASDMYNLALGKNLYEFSDHVIKPYYKRLDKQSQS